MSVAVQSAMSIDFLDALGRLPRHQQKGARSLISKFTRNPTSPGLNYETIHGAKDRQMRSLRIDESYRAIVHRPVEGNTYMLLWADKHDEAYRWAKRHQCDVNPETGAIQVYQPQTVTPPSTQGTIKHGLPPPQGPFASLRARELTRLGVPAALAAQVRGWTGENDLERNKERLPLEAYESLFFYLAGDSYEKLVRDREVRADPVDPNDLATALLRDDSRSRFVLIHDEVELEAMLNAPLEKWRVFLHPTQRKLVERERNGPVRVLGGAGTGKTVVAMHRARWLANQEDSGKILFVTFTRNLAIDIENNLRQICGEKEMKRIEVRTLDSWVMGYLKSRQCDFDILYGQDDHAWRQALGMKAGGLKLSDEFYRVEWRQVVQANGITAEREYKRVSRVGRGTALNRAARSKVWRVFEEYRRQLAERGLKEVDDAYAAAAALVRNEEELGYSSVIVDEAQDIGPQAFRLIRTLVPKGKNDLFITGDGHQAIYDRRVVLGRCGINIRGRSFKLKLNYRTTEQTRGWASRLLEGRDIDDLDGGKDDNSGIRSLTQGPEPVVGQYSTAAEQAKAIADYLKSLERAGERLGNTCVLARTTKERNAIRDLLRSEGLEVVVVDKESDDGSAKGVRLATMHRVKGLEFERVVLASMNRNLVPLPYLLKNAPDEERRVAIETMERALVYVAASRAKRELLVLSYGNPSRFLGR